MGGGDGSDVTESAAAIEPVPRVSGVDRGPCLVVVVTQSSRHPHSFFFAPSLYKPRARVNDTSPGREDEAYLATRRVVKNSYRTLR